MVQRRAELRRFALPLLLAGVIFGIMGWAAAFTTLGVELIIVGSVATVAAAVLRPTWWFVLVCGLAVFCIWGGPILVIAAIAGG